VAKLRGIIPLLGDTKIDWLFGGLIILFIFELTSIFRLLEKVLGFLGKQLFNIFLFHTFIYYYYWSEFIYSFQNPLLIFFALLSLSTVISLIIEQLKRRVYFNELIGKVSKLQVPPNIEITFQQDAPADARTLRR